MIYKLDTLTVFPRYEIISVKYDIVKGSISYLPLKFIQFLSITTKDLINFFQLFSSTENNLRPFFTVDLLKIMINILYDILTCHFHRTGSKRYFFVYQIWNTGIWKSIKTKEHGKEFIKRRKKQIRKIHQAQ